MKQSIFDILSPRIDGARVYDCFAGTGSFGIESLSRGASHATFFESHRPTLALLRRNLATLALNARATIVSADWFTHLRSVAARGDVDLVFLDPPYRFLNERADDLVTAAASLAKHLSPDGLVCFRHDSADSLALPPLSQVETREYGSMTVELLHRPKNDS